MPGPLPSGDRTAGFAEVWAARAWNVFNEGKPFAVVYPPLAVAGAALIGAGPEGPLWRGLLAGLALSVVWARYPFALRGRALLWALLVPGALALQEWRAPGLLAVGAGGYAFFTVFFWGGLYYRLRTRAPRTNSLRFWRLVATNSDPTSGNALEQLPKLALTLAAVALVAEQPGGGSWARVAGVAVAAALVGELARRHFARTRLPRYPERARAAAATGALARRVYVIVIDGCNRERLRQASALGRTPAIDRLVAEGTEYLDVQTAYPARTVVCFSSMLTGATPAEHGMRSNFVARLGVRVPSVFDVLAEHGRRGRLVGIAHLLDPFGERRVRSVTSVQPTERIDHSLCAAARAVVAEEDPDLLVVQLLAADQLGHVRGTRNPEYLDQLAETDRRIAELLAFLRERGRLDGATVVLMADHGQGRGIGGHGHLDWGETPVPFVVWGAGAVPGAVCGRPSSVLELAATVSRLLGVPPPASARGRALVPVEDPDVSVVRQRAVLLGSAGAEDAEALLRPVREGRAEHVVAGAAPRGLTDRLRSALLGARMGGRVVWSARPAARALSARALAHLAADERPEALTLRLHHAGFPPEELLLDQRRYSRSTSAASAAAPAHATTSAHAEPTP